MGQYLLGHFLAFLSVFFWSSLYVSTKILLEDFTPLELLVMQFVIGYLFLLIIKVITPIKISATKTPINT